MELWQHYRLKRVGERWVVLDAHTPKGESPVLIGTIRGDSAFGFTVKVRGTTPVPTDEPIRVVDHAAQLLYLEYLFTLTPAQKEKAA